MTHPEELERWYETDFTADGFSETSIQAIDQAFADGDGEPGMVVVGLFAEEATEPTWVEGAFLDPFRYDDTSFLIHRDMEDDFIKVLRYRAVIEASADHWASPADKARATAWYEDRDLSGALVRINEWKESRP